jgi:asparagine synthase (glutamine-hydrolysing)
MCGIAGIIGPESTTPEIKEKLEKMGETIHHRGPDDDGYYFDEDISLAFRRLSIIDLQTGHQPIFNEDQSKLIIFNGEAYNFRELRPGLVENGHHFSTYTDTEVILHLYEDLGYHCVDQLIGMFAFCIWDKNKKSAFLVRDRLGIKPLYYTFSTGNFIFASEIKTIFASGLIDPEISYENVNHYLTYRFTPAPGTTFNGIYKLPPGHYLVYNQGEVKVERYWNVKDFGKSNKSEDTIKKTLLEKLTAAVERRLVSDVPLGLFLSGGIDSSAMLAIMSRLMSEPVKTFSVGFDFDEKYQEFEFANKVAEIFHSDHHTMLVSAREFIQAIPKLVWYLDEPVADSAVIPLLFIAKLAKKYITVALSGEGSDEIFAGYARLYNYDYNRHRRKKILRRLPEITRGNFATRVFENVFPKYLDKFIFIKSPIELDKIISMGNYFSTEQKKNLFNDELWGNIKNKDSYFFIEESLKNYPELEYLDRKLIIDMLYWLPDDLLIKADRATMANAVELRVPFLDHEIVEFAFTIKDRFKINNGQGKYILKKALEEILPHEVIHRPKMGFPVPLSEWFAGELKENVREILLGDRAVSRNIFNYNAVKNLLDDHTPGKRNLSGFIWILVIFEIWCRIFIDGDPYQNIHLI